MEGIILFLEKGVGGGSGDVPLNQVVTSWELILEESLSKEEGSKFDGKSPPVFPMFLLGGGV